MLRANDDYTSKISVKVGMAVTKTIETGRKVHPILHTLLGSMRWGTFTIKSSYEARQL